MLYFQESVKGSDIPLKQGSRVVIKSVPGEKYNLIDPATGKTPKDLTAKRVNKDLHLRSDIEDTEVILEDFWGECEAGNQCFAILDTPEVAGGELTGQTIITQVGENIELLAGQIGQLGNTAVVSALGTAPVGLWALAGIAGAVALASAGGSGGGSGDVPAPVADNNPQTPQKQNQPQNNNGDNNGNNNNGDNGSGTSDTPNDVTITVTPNTDGGLEVVGKAEPNTKVEIDVDGDGTPEVTADVDGDGNFTATVQADDLPTDQEQLEVTATAKDDEGNQVGEPAKETVDNPAYVNELTVTLDTNNIGGADNVINATEKENAQTVEIKVDNLQDGEEPVFKLGDETLSGSLKYGTTDTYEVSIPADKLNLADTEAGEKHSVSISVSGSKNSVAKDPVAADYAVDTTAPVASIIEARVQPDGSVLVSGYVSENADVAFGDIEANVEGNDDDGYVFTLTIPKENAPAVDSNIAVTVTDAVGNVANSSESQVLPNQFTATLVDNLIGGDDNTISASEVNDDQIVVIKVEGLQNGEEPVFKLDGETLSGNLKAGETDVYEVTIPASKLNTGTDTDVDPRNISIDVSANKGSELKGPLVEPAGYYVDTTAPTVSNIEVVKNDDGTVSITATVDSDAKQVLINGQEAVVSNGQATLELASVSDLGAMKGNITAVATDNAGNTGNETTQAYDITPNLNDLPVTVDWDNNKVNVGDESADITQETSDKDLTDSDGTVYHTHTAGWVTYDLKDGKHALPSNSDLKGKTYATTVGNTDVLTSEGNDVIVVTDGFGHRVAGGYNNIENLNTGAGDDYIFLHQEDQNYGQSMEYGGVIGATVLNTGSGNDVFVGSYINVDESFASSTGIPQLNMGDGDDYLNLSGHYVTGGGARGSIFNADVNMGSGDDFVALTYGVGRWSDSDIGMSVQSYLQGGDGFDTLTYTGTGVVQYLDNTATNRHSSIKGFEVIDLGQGNTLKGITASSILDSQDHTLTIQGDSSDKVEMSANNWVNTNATQDVAGVTYNVYTQNYNGDELTVLVQQGIQII